jgi:signal transduction histidine kinase
MQYAHELRVEVPEHPIWVHGDAARLTQVFSNLLHNAVKFSELDGRIVVTVARDRGQAVVVVRDEGIGIAADHLPSIFEAFEQGGRSPDATRGGLGLGLTLVKQFVEMHGGTVVAKSDGIGTGSEFSVRLPALRDERTI